MKTENQTVREQREVLLAIHEQDAPSPVEFAKVGTTAELFALRAERDALRSALEKIHAGNAPEKKDAWTLLDVIQEHYKICRAALAEKEAK